MSSKTRLLLPTFAASFAAAFVIKFVENKQLLSSANPTAQVLGELLGMAVGLWGISGVAILMSSPRTALRNTLLLLIVITALILFGQGRSV